MNWFKKKNFQEINYRFRPLSTSAVIIICDFHEIVLDRAVVVIITDARHRR